MTELPFASFLRCRYVAWRWAMAFHEFIPGWPRRRRIQGFLARRYINAYFTWEKAVKG